MVFFFFFQAEDGIRDLIVTGVQTCALPIQAEDGIRDLNSSHDQISYAVFCLKKQEHTSELDQRSDIVCRLLLEKRKKTCRPIGKHTHMRYPTTHHTRSRTATRRPPSHTLL